MKAEYKNSFQRDGGGNFICDRDYFFFFLLSENAYC